jgi:hypothetical protein
MFFFSQTNLIYFLRLVVYTYKFDEFVNSRSETFKEPEVSKFEPYQAEICNALLTHYSETRL